MNSFIILSHPRSGTSYFVHGILDKHPEIVCHGELFSNTQSTKGILKHLDLMHFHSDIYRASKRFYEPQKFLESYKERIFANTDKKFLGFKIFPEQLMDYDIITLCNSWSPILLTRKNMAQSAISYEIALSTGQWNQSQKDNTMSFEADIQRMTDFIEKYSYYINNYRSYLKKNKIRYLDLEYEKLFTQESLGQIRNFLGTSVHFSEDFNFKDSKLNNVDRYKTLISNVTEVRNELLHKGYGDIFEE